MIDVPVLVDKITPHGVSAALFDDRPQRIAAVGATSMNNGRGFLGQNLRLGLTHEAPAAVWVAFLVAKIKPNDETFRQSAAEISAFEREVGLRLDHSRRVPIRLPVTHLAMGAGHAWHCGFLASLEWADVAAVNEKPLICITEANPTMV